MSQEKMIEAGVRLDCLKLASVGREGWAAGDVIKVADQMFDYVMQTTIVEGITENFSVEQLK